MKPFWNQTDVGKSRLGKTRCSFQAGLKCWLFQREVYMVCAKFVIPCCPFLTRLNSARQRAKQARRRRREGIWASLVSQKLHGYQNFSKTVWTSGLFAIKRSRSSQSHFPSHWMWTHTDVSLLPFLANVPSLNIFVYDAARMWIY